MPAYIPYSHPSLQIGSVVDPALLSQFNQLNDLQQQIDTAHDGLNSLIMMKRSLTMTVNELSDMQVNTEPIVAELTSLNAQITAAATDYMHKRIENEKTMQTIRAEMKEANISTNAEPVIDFGASKYEARPFASESLNLDSQFFSFGSNMQDDMVANVEKFVRNSVGQTTGVAEQTAKAVSAQLMNQVQNHSISGTLIIVASCQHRNTGVFNPLVLDPDKALHTWNALHPNNKIDPEEDLSKMQDVGADSLSIITGATYGSSFVGMVHILRSDTMQMDDYEKIRTKFDDKIKLDGWLSNVTGSFGVSEAALGDLRAIISNKSINSHVSAIIVGAMASLKADHAGSLTKEANGVTDEIIQKSINLGKSENSSVNSESNAAMQKALILNIENSRVTQIMEKAHVLDEKSNSTLNINSLMTLFTKYLENISNKDALAGTPVSFSIKKLTKSDIVRLLTRKSGTEKEKEKEKEKSDAKPAPPDIGKKP